MSRPWRNIDSSIFNNNDISKLSNVSGFFPNNREKTVENKSDSDNNKPLDNINILNHNVDTNPAFDKGNQRTPTQDARSKFNNFANKTSPFFKPSPQVTNTQLRETFHDFSQGLHLKQEKGGAWGDFTPTKPTQQSYIAPNHSSDDASPPSQKARGEDGSSRSTSNENIMPQYNRLNLHADNNKMINSEGPQQMPGGVAMPDPYVPYFPSETSGSSSTENILSSSKKKSQSKRKQFNNALHASTINHPSRTVDAKIPEKASQKFQQKLGSYLESNSLFTTDDQSGMDSKIGNYRNFVLGSNNNEFSQHILKEIKGYTERIKQLEDENSHLKTEHFKLREKLMSINSEYDEIKTENTELASEVRALKVKVADISSAKSHLDDELFESKATIHNLTREINDLKAEKEREIITRASSMFDDASKHKETAEKYEQDIKSMREFYENSEKFLNDRIRDLTQKNSTLEMRLKDLEKSTNERTGDYSTLRIENQQLLYYQEKMNEELNELKGHLESQQETIQQLNHSLAAKTENLENAQLEIQSSNKKNEELQSKLNERQNEMEILQAKLKESQQELEKIRIQFNSKQDELTTVQVKLEELAHIQDQFNVKQKELEKTKTELAENQKELEKLTADLSKYKISEDKTPANDNQTKEENTISGAEKASLESILKDLGLYLAQELKKSSLNAEVQQKSETQKTVQLNREQSKSQQKPQMQAQHSKSTISSENVQQQLLNHFLNSTIQFLKNYVDIELQNPSQVEGIEQTINNEETESIPSTQLSTEQDLFLKFIDGLKHVISSIPTDSTKSKVDTSNTNIQESQNPNAYSTSYPEAHINVAPMGRSANIFNPTQPIISNTKSSSNGTGTTLFVPEAKFSQERDQNIHYTTDQTRLPHLSQNDQKYYYTQYDDRNNMNVNEYNNNQYLNNSAPAPLFTQTQVPKAPRATDTFSRPTTFQTRSEIPPYRNSLPNERAQYNEPPQVRNGSAYINNRSIPQAYPFQSNRYRDMDYQIPADDPCTSGPTYSRVASSSGKNAQRASKTSMPPPIKQLHEPHGSSSNYAQYSTEETVDQQEEQDYYNPRRSKSYSNNASPFRVQQTPNGNTYLRNMQDPNEANPQQYMEEKNGDYYLNGNNFSPSRQHQRSQSMFVQSPIRAHVCSGASMHQEDNNIEDEEASIRRVGKHYYANGGGDKSFVESTISLGDENINFSHRFGQTMQ